MLKINELCKCSNYQGALCSIMIQSAYYKILVDRFNQINHEIEKLREQQNFIAGMLKNNDLLRTSELINMNTWMMLMRSSGFDEDQLKQKSTV